MTVLLCDFGPPPRRLTRPHSRHVVVLCPALILTLAVVPGISSEVHPLQIQWRCEIGKGKRFLDEVFTKCLAAFLLAIIGIETSVMTAERWSWASIAL